MNQSEISQEIVNSTHRLLEQIKALEVCPNTPNGVNHRQINYDNQKESIDEILKDPATHFERITEQLVKAALEQMKDKKFKGTIKVMVDILKKWIIIQKV